MHTTSSSLKTVIASCVGLLISFAVPQRCCGDSEPRIPERPTIDSPGDQQWKKIDSPAEKAKVFDLLFKSGSSNYQRIRAWEASYKVSTDGGDLPQSARREGTVHFAVDLVQDSLNWRYKAEKEEFFDGEKQSWVPSKTLLGFRGVFLPDSAIVLPSDLPALGNVISLGRHPVKNVLIANRCDPKRAATSPVSERSDPRYFFCFMRGKEWYTYWHSFDRMAAALRGDRGEEKQETYDRDYKAYEASYKDTTWYKVEHHPPVREIPMDEFLFSGDDGLNIVSRIQFLKDGRPRIMNTWGYTQEDGVFIPQEYAVFFNNGTARLDYRLLESRLNESISPDQFTFKGLGLKDGDLVLDDIKRVGYIVKNDELVKLSNYGERPPREEHLPEQQPISSRIVLVLTTLLLFIAVAVVTVLRKRSSGGSRPPQEPAA